MSKRKKRRKKKTRWEKDEEENPTGTGGEANGRCERTVCVSNAQKENTAGCVRGESDEEVRKIESARSDAV